jgi:hypothetical protein
MFQSLGVGCGWGSSRNVLLSIGKPWSNPQHHGKEVTMCLKENMQALMCKLEKEVNMTISD